MSTPTPATRRPQADVLAGPQRTAVLDVAVALVCAAAVWAPLALGATGEWPRLGLEATIAAAVILWAAAGRGSAWALGLPVVILGTALLQVMPLPDRLLVAIAPISAGAWKIALAGTADGWGRISVDPAATAAAARRLFLGAALVAAVADLARCRTYRIWLTAALSTAAGLIIAAGLAFPVQKQQRIMLGFVDLKGPIEWWRTPLAPPVQSGGWAYVENVCAGEQCYTSDLAIVGDAYGSYICCNKFAGAVCLTLPVALAAFLFWTRHKLPAILRYAITLAVFAGTLWMLGVTISSRAGFAALLAAVLVLYSLCIEHRRLRLVANVIAVCYVALVVIFAALLIGQFQSIAGFFPQPLEQKVVALLSDGRAVAAGAAARMFRASPILGTGLGTFDDLWPRMMPGSTTFYYAHNDYAQAIAEAGLLGLITMLACGIGLVRRYLRFASGATFPERILEAGPWAATAAICIHSAFDWNLHVPANAFLACLVCGLALGSSNLTPALRPAAGAGSTIGRMAGFAFIAVCVATLALLGRDAWVDAVERSIREAVVADRLVSKDAASPTTVPRLLAAIEAGDTAARWASRDSRLHAVLAQANVHVAARHSANDTNMPGTRAGYLNAALRHSRAARSGNPTVRGLPESAPRKPRPPEP